MSTCSQGSVPTTSLCETAGIKNHSPVFTDVVTRLFKSWHCTSPGGINRDAPFVVVTTHAQLLQRLNDFNTDGANARIHAVCIVERTRRTNNLLLTFMEDQKVSINHTKVGIDTQTTDEHHGSVMIEPVEVIAIVKVAITRCDMAHRFRCLVDWEVVEI